jgi:mycothiol synthase
VQLWGDGYVHPKHTGLGIGSHLVDLIEERCDEYLRRSPGATLTLNNVIAGNDAAACALLCERGYTITRHDWEMAIAVDKTFERPGAPAGITVEPFDWDRDAEELHRVVNAAFSEHRNNAPRPFDQWVAEAKADPRFDPSLWWVARDAASAEIVGALIGIDFGRYGHVRTLGVLKSHRGRGVGEALLKTSFAQFAERGHTRVGLGVDSENATGATRLYERAGMHVERSFVFHTKEMWGR